MSVDAASSHYDVGGVEVMAVLRAKLTQEQFEGFLLGNVIKYALRANWKGETDRDVEKATIYARLLDEERKRRRG